MQRSLLLFLFLCLPPFQTRADELSLETDSVSKDYAAELPRIAPTEPRDALAKFQIVDGFRINLAANEPLISDPVAIAFDERGRLFVVCMRGYSEHRDDSLGLVRLLEDTDADGVFDQGTNYVTGLAWPTAVACYDGGIFVGAAPDIWYCKDTNADGVAEMRDVIFTGFGYQNVQGMLNSFRWGLDNRLYGATGTNGGTITKPGDSGEPLSLHGRDFSIDPHARTMRAESGGAQHGATIDRWGERYVCSNSNHLQWIQFEDRHLQRNPLLSSYGYQSRRSIAIDGPSAEVYRTSAVEPWRVVRTRLRVKGMVSGPVEGGGRASGYFTSASGVTAYTGDAFPGAFQDGEHVFVGDVGSNLVHLKQIETNGLERAASRVSDDKSEFLTSTDNWFRPVQFANGPDGALYVIDMYRETIEHPLSLPPMIKQHVDLNSGRTRGRIYRITPSETRMRPRLLPAAANDSQLVAMLSHPNGWHRETAARLIVSRSLQSVAVREKFAGLIRNHTKGTPDGRIRETYCLQSLGLLSEGGLIGRLNDPHPHVRQHALKVVEAANNAGEATIGQLESMLDEKVAQVRYQLMLTWGKFDWDARAAPLADLASQASDSSMEFALLSAMGEQRLELLRLLLGGDNADHTLALANAIAHQIGRQRQAVGEPIRLLNTQPPEVRERLTERLLSGIGLSGRRLIELLASQHVNDPQGLVDEVVSSAGHAALNGDAPLASRLFAISVLSLGNYKQARATYGDLLSPQQPAEVRDAVVEQLGNYETMEVADTLLARINTLSPQGRRGAFDLLTTRAAWAQLLLDRVADQSLSATQIAARHRQQLLNHRNSDVASHARATLGMQADRTAVVERLTSVLNGVGDVARGELAFRKVCATCHRLDEYGVNVGPDLAPLRNRGAAFMLTNILDPNREVDARYEAYNVLTSDGRTHTGILTSDSATSVSLLLAEGKTKSISKAEIEDLQATGLSLMPEGLELELTKQGIADVIAYLIQPDTFEEAKAGKP